MRGLALFGWVILDRERSEILDGRPMQEYIKKKIELSSGGNHHERTYKEENEGRVPERN